MTRGGSKKLISRNNWSHQATDELFDDYVSKFKSVNNDGATVDSKCDIIIKSDIFSIKKYLIYPEK